MNEPIIRLPGMKAPQALEQRLKLRGLTPRERHILVTAKVKRKVMAAAWRSLRSQDRKRANQQFKEMKGRRRGYCQT